MKLNKPGPYWQRYRQVRGLHGYEYVDGSWTKVREGLHDDWPFGRVHRHCMLLASKRFLREMYNAWTGTSHARDGWKA